MVKTPDIVTSEATRPKNKHCNDMTSHFGRLCAHFVVASVSFFLSSSTKTFLKVNSFIFNYVHSEMLSVLNRIIVRRFSVFSK